MDTERQRLLEEVRVEAERWVQWAAVWDSQFSESHGLVQAVRALMQYELRHLDEKPALSYVAGGILNDLRKSGIVSGPSNEGAVERAHAIVHRNLAAIFAVGDEMFHDFLNDFPIDEEGDITELLYSRWHGGECKCSTCVAWEWRAGLLRRWLEATDMEKRMPKRDTKEQETH